MRSYKKIISGVAIALSLPALAWGQDAPTLESLAANDAFVFNTLLFLLGGFLVMWMAAGFAMLESGFVRTKNVSMQCLKNISLYSVAGLMFWVLGYQLMYGGGDYFGKFAIMSFASEDIATGYSSYSDWFFQMVFCATTMSIVSGTLAERIKIWPFFLFAAILTGIIYPIEMGWQWGGGWLSTAGFSDFAGSTLVHAAGGAAALAGAIVLGARSGRFSSRGEAKPMAPFAASSIPLATLGVFILWMGWFGFNGGSQLAAGTLEDVSSVATIYINTNLAAGGGVITAAIISRLIGGKTDVVMMLNGAIAGLVAITAEPLTPSPLAAIFIGAIGGLVMYFSTKLLFKLKIDDVVGAIPAHLVAGVWGTLAVPLTNADVSFGAQFLGTISVVVFVFIVSFIVFKIMKATVGLRISKEAERLGTDKAEIGVIAYGIRD